MEQLHPVEETRSEIKDIKDITKHTWQFLNMVHKEGVATLLVTSDLVLKELIKKKEVQFPLLSTIVKKPPSWKDYKGISVIIDPNSISLNCLIKYYSNLEKLSNLYKERAVVIMRYNPFLCRETQIPYKFIASHSTIVMRSYREVYK